MDERLNLRACHWHHKKVSNTKLKGLISEEKIILKILQGGFTVSRPLGDYSPYDLLIEFDDFFIRVQCKTGKTSKDGTIIKFETSKRNCRSKNEVTNRKRKSYVTRADFFGVYCPQNDECYIVPVSNFSSEAGKGRLRLVKPKNNQKKNITMAEDWKLVDVLLHLEIDYWFKIKTRNKVVVNTICKI